MRKRDVLIQFLLTQDESDSFNDHVKRSGFTRSAYLRMLIRGIIPADRPPPDYHAMINELNAIGVSLNQIARKAHVLGVIAIPRPRRTGQPAKKAMPLPKGNLIGLYRHYKYLFGHYSRGSPNNERMQFLLREEIRAFDAITNELKLLEREGIETAEQLLSFEEKLGATIDSLTDERKTLHAEAKTAQASGTTDKPPRIAEINEKLKTLRREVKQCKRIEERSLAIQDKIMQLESEQEKEAAEHGRIGTGGRTARKDNARR